MGGQVTTGTTAHGLRYAAEGGWRVVADAAGGGHTRSAWGGTAWRCLRPGEGIPAGVEGRLLAALGLPGRPRYDVRASVWELDGDGSDGAYDLIGDGLTADEVAERVRQALSGGGPGLTNSGGPFALSIHVGPAGSGDRLPL